jgi:hypothetical protein
MSDVVEQSSDAGHPDPPALGASTGIVEKLDDNDPHHSVSASSGGDGTDHAHSTAPSSAPVPAPSSAPVHLAPVPAPPSATSAPLFSAAQAEFLTEIRIELFAWQLKEDEFSVAAKPFVANSKPFAEHTSQDAEVAFAISRFLEACRIEIDGKGDWAKGLEHLSDRIRGALEAMPPLLSKCALATQHALDDSSKPDEIRARLHTCFPALAVDLIQKMGGYKEIVELKGAASPVRPFSSLASPHIPHRCP